MVKSKNNFLKETRILNNNPNGLPVLEDINGRLQTLEKKIDDLQSQMPETDSIKANDTFSRTRAYWDNWQDCVKSQVIGFMNYGLDERLIPNKKYGVQIGPVVLVGERLQMIAQLYDVSEDGEEILYDCPCGIFVQDYQIGSADYYEMILAVYAPVFKMLIEINLNQFSDVVGMISFKTTNGHIHLNWRSFDPIQTPCSHAWGFSEQLVEKLKKNKQQ